MHFSQSASEIELRLSKKARELIDKQAKTSHLEICNGHFKVQLWIITVPAPTLFHAVGKGINDDNVRSVMRLASEFTARRSLGR